MNRRVVLSSLALLALAGFLGWLLRAHMFQEKAHEREILARAAQQKTVLPPAPAEPPKPVAAAEYFDVAQRMLFSKDRNPTVIVEVKPPPPKPPLPPLPQYYGQIGFGPEPGIFLSTAASPQKIYHAGDKIGDKDKFVIVSFDRDRITLGFNDETVEKKLEELRPKKPAPDQAAAANPAPQQQPAAPRSAPLSAASLADGNPDKKDEVIGADYGNGYRAAVPGDTTPAGAIKDGYKKVCAHTLFGQDCHWESVK